MQGQRKPQPETWLTPEQEKEFGYVIVVPGLIKHLKGCTYSEAVDFAREELAHDLDLKQAMIYKPCHFVATESTMSNTFKD